MPNFSGKWNLDGQLRGIKQGTWTGISVEAFNLYATGFNSGVTAGALGLNDVIPRSSPVQVGSEGFWSSQTHRSIGLYHSVHISSNGELYTWGDGNLGRTGQNGTADTSSPTQVGSLTNWSKLEAGDSHTIALKTDGTIWAWGDDFHGQCGQNTHNVSVSSPVQIGALTNWADVSAGQNHCLAIKTDGTWWTWGRNYSGGLGQNDTVDRSSPVQIGALTDWSLTTGLGNNSFAINTGGELYAIGEHFRGQLGNNAPSNTDASSPVQVGVDTDWALLRGGARCSTPVGIKNNGTMWTWGSGINGVSGHNDTTMRSSPTQIGALTTWSKAASSYHCAAIKTDGTWWAWGHNSSGRLGDGTTVNKSSPIQIGSKTNWSDVSVSNIGTMALEDVSYRTGMS